MSVCRLLQRLVAKQGRLEWRAGLRSQAPAWLCGGVGQATFSSGALCVCTGSPALSGGPHQAMSRPMRWSQVMSSLLRLLPVLPEGIYDTDLAAVCRLNVMDCTGVRAWWKDGPRLRFPCKPFDWAVCQSDNHIASGLAYPAEALVRISRRRAARGSIAEQPGIDGPLRGPEFAALVSIGDHPQTLCNVRRIQGVAASSNVERSDGLAHPGALSSDQTWGGRDRPRSAPLFQFENGRVAGFRGTEDTSQSADRAEVLIACQRRG